MRLSPKTLLMTALLASLPGLAVAFEPPQIVLGTLGDGLSAFSASGSWPDTCPPQLLDMTIEGRDITLLAGRETEGCRATPTPYAFASRGFESAELLADGGIYRVRLMLEEASDEPVKLIGFALVGTTAAAPTLETGFWWAEEGGEFDAGPGLGLSVETQGKLISLSAMGYDAGGNATWYFGAGETRDGVGHLELGQFEGGAGPFARYSAPETIHFSGTVDVETVSPSRAVLWFSQVDPARGALNLKPLSIVRFSFAQDPAQALLGRWVLTGDSADARATRWLNFTRSQATENGFTLYDVEGALLSCETAPGLVGSPPALCRLDFGDGDLIELTDIALRRLSGWDADTRRSLAFRID